MFGEDEPPPTLKEKEFIRFSIDNARKFIKTSSDPITVQVIDPILGHLVKALKKDVNEVHIRPEMDWIVKPNDKFKHKSSSIEITSDQYQDIVEKFLLKFRWHYEFHEQYNPPVYVIFFKCFGEVLGKKAEIVASMTEFSMSTKKSPSTRSKKDDDTKKSKSRSLKKSSKHSRVHRELKRTSSNISNSSTSSRH